MCALIFLFVYLLLLLIPTNFSKLYLTFLTSFFPFLIFELTLRAIYNPLQSLQPCISHSICMFDYTQLFTIMQPLRHVTSFCVPTKTPSTTSTTITRPNLSHCGQCAAWHWCFGKTGSWGGLHPCSCQGITVMYTATSLLLLLSRSM